MEFVVTCQNDISDLILISISFVWVKGHQVQIQNHHLSVITNLCLPLLWLKRS